MKKSKFNLQFQGGSSSSSSNLYLPEEIMLKIIAPLPAKSVGRCRCVSKHWRNLLSDPSFIKTHLNMFLNNPPYKALSKTQRSLFEVVDFHGTSHDPVVFAPELIKLDVPIYSWELVMFRCSHNGLILIQEGIWANQRYFNDRLFLLNPTTLECQEFPKPPVHCKDHFVFGMGNDKAVAINSNDCSSVYVYTFKSNTASTTGTSTWKRLQIPSSALDHGNVRFLFNAEGVVCNGCIYWVGYTGGLGPSRTLIIAFDLTEETIRAIPAPIARDWRSTLGVVGGSLCIYSEEICEYSRSKLDVWVMNEYGHDHKEEDPNWTKTSFLYRNMNGRVIFMGNEEMMLISEDRSKAVIYNIKEKSSRDVVVSGLPTNVGYCCTFVDSLVSPRQLL